MIRFSKTSLITALAISFVFTAKISYAQYPGMAAVRAQQNQQFMNQQMRMQMDMNMNRNWRETAEHGGKYILVLKDSSKKRVISYIYNDSVSHKNFLVAVDKKFRKSDTAHRYQKIYPDQTLSITAIITDEHGDDETRYGIPTDSCWILKVITGPITVYAKSGDYISIASTSVFGSPRFDFYQAQIIGIQLNDGPIEKLSKKAVLKMVADNPKASELIEKKGLYEAVKRYNRDAEKATKK